MGHPQIAAFARLADGSAKATRNVAGQKTLLGRVTHGIAYDPIHDEFTVPQPLGQAILTFQGGANGEEPPIRVIQGSLTQLQYSHTLTTDPVHNEIFVPDSEGGVMVYPREANGNVAPIRILKGPAGARFRATALAVDPVSDLLVVAGSANGQQGLFIFNRTDEGNATPKSAITGPKTGLRPVTGSLVIYPPKGWIILSNSGQGPRGPGEGTGWSDESFVGVWSINDNGDVPPRWRIGGPKGILRMATGVVLDPKNKSLIVSDMALNAVMTFSFPEIF